ncbi:hypothetical protein MOXK02_18860 [Moraxella sp. K02]
MGTIASLTTTANQITKLLELAVEPLNEKLEETGYKVIFRQVKRGKDRVTEAFLSFGIWRQEVISLSDDDLPKLLTMNPDDIVKYLKS